MPLYRCGFCKIDLDNSVVIQYHLVLFFDVNIIIILQIYSVDVDEKFHFYKVIQWPATVLPSMQTTI